MSEDTKYHLVLFIAVAAILAFLVWDREKKTEVCHGLGGAWVCYNGAYNCACIPALGTKK